MPERKVREERERAVVGGLVLLMLLLWLGFLVHRSRTFPGSALGHAIGIAGAVLMLAPLAYVFIKRIPRLRSAVTRRFPMRTLLAWHIYAGLLGPILVLVHTGHHFESPLGIALSTMTIVVVLSGWVGRYLMRSLNTELREKKDLLRQAVTLYDDTRAAVAEARGVVPAVSRVPGEAELVRIAESRADLEYAVGTHERFKRWFASWLRFHIVLSVLLYALLALHIWATIHFGLRWL